MKCAYNNRFVHFAFGASLLSDKNTIISRNTFESLQDFSSDDKFLNDDLQISSKLLLLSIYINHTNEIERAFELIELQLKQKLLPSYLVLFYLAKGICFINRGKSRIFLYKRDYLLQCAIECFNLVIARLFFNCFRH